ncbi:MAG TPA: NADH dehydrogenase (quinone) subunit D [Armatimonadota bacterium]|nr:NADH dehydrogenase (quinone) subunit D [Armatimonadota bacterium]
MANTLVTKDLIPQTIQDIAQKAQTLEGKEIHLRAEKEAILHLCQALRNDSGLNYNFLSDITAVDYYTAESRFELVYRMYSIPEGRRLWIKVPVGIDQEVDTVTSVWKNADWMEREVFDMFGIRFSGHPDLRRILMPANWIGHPLRKDHPIGSEEVQFTVNTGDITSQIEFLNSRFEGMDFFGYVERGSELNTLYGAEKMKKYEEEGKIILNMGPQHPSTHGVLRVILALEGETIVDADLDIGYLHTGIEKQAEQLIYQQALTLTDRMDYVAPLMNNLGYSMSVEKILGVEVPPRGQYLRVLLAELTRIGSHLVWLGTHALEIGAVTVFLYCFQDRELLLDIFELLSGQRMMTSWINIGGLRDDIPEGFTHAVKNFLEVFPPRLKEYHTLLTNNPIWLKRTKGIGYLSLEDALDYGVSGPILRAAGMEFDVRKTWPYSAYSDFEFDIPTGENSDVYDRYLVRMEEMRQSLRIAEQALAKLPEGDYRIEDYKIVLPPRQRLDVSMESLIHHFLVATQGFLPPKGDAYVSYEGPRGETGYYIVSDGSGKPYRMHMRSPSFSALQSMPLMVRGHYVSDVISVLGSVDMIMGEVDR